ncbi:hypothetical protein FQA39_LY14992 [Lamprigera yunnana]|nr:hypothetical protein FQA39_LY14992 [Lamprigera yunnana]
MYSLDSGAQSVQLVYMCPATQKESCSWEGTSLDVLDHLLYEHPNIILESNTFWIDLSQPFKNHIMATKSGLFLVQTQMTNRKMNVRFQLRFLSFDNADVNLLRYTVEIVCNSIGFTNENANEKYNPVVNVNNGVEVDIQAIELVVGRKIRRILVKINIHQYFKKSLNCVNVKNLKIDKDECDSASLNHFFNDLNEEDNDAKSTECDINENNECLRSESMCEIETPLIEVTVPIFFSIDTLRCTNCKCYMIPPIHICPNSHNVCYNCRSNMCNVCNESITSSRNKELEDYSKTLDIPCRYKELGCTTKLKYYDIRKHELNCVHYTYKCELCTYEGKLGEIATHFRIAHPSTKIYETMSGIHFPKGSNFIILNSFGVFYCTSSATDIYIEWKCHMKMMKLKPNLLQKLRCDRCEGYLRVAPIIATFDKCQICGKCYKILPLEDKKNCVRLHAFETVAEILLFPCRYSNQGCQFLFKFNEMNNHELDCSFRFYCSNSNEEGVYEDIQLYNRESKVNRDLPKSVSDNIQLTFVASDICQNVNVENNFLLKYNATNTPSILKYSMQIVGKSGTFLQLTNKQFNNYTKSPIKMGIEGALYLSDLQNIYSNVTINDDASTSNVYLYDELSKPIQDKKASVIYPKCVTCNGVIKNEIYHCTIGHNICYNCKANNCTLCTSPINSTPRYYCKNFAKGCSVYLFYTDLNLHIKDCEYGKFFCPFVKQCHEKCETLSHLKHHLKDGHTVYTTCTLVKQSSTKDEFWIILIFDSIFQCKFFYYDCNIEILVELVGAKRNVEKYKYEVVIESKHKQVAKIVRSSKCANWQASILEQCVSITKKELQAIRVNFDNFCYTLNIYEISSSV